MAPATEKVPGTLRLMFGGSGLPWVTIVTPSLNQGAFIRGAIESVLAQTYPNVEYIIIDAVSTDETKSVVAQYVDRLAFVSEPDRGQSHAINKGWKMGKGEILGWLCADDLLLPDAVQTIVDTFCRHPDASFVFGGCELLDRHGNMTGVWLATAHDPWKLIHGYDYVAQPAAFCARRAVEAVGFVDETLHFGMDWDLFIRLSAFGPVVPSAEVLARAHVYLETKSASGGYRRWRELAAITRKHGNRRYPPAYFVYGVDALRSGGRHWIRRHPGLASMLGPQPRRWIHSAIDRVHRRAIRHATRGWFDDSWAGPAVTRQLVGDGRTLALRGRLPLEYPDLAGQRLKVTCDGTVLAHRDLMPGSFSWSLPLPARRDDSVEIKIRSRRSFVPKRFGLNHDFRRLAFVLDELGLAGACEAMQADGMERALENRDPPVPLFSVIIPLEWHRERWEHCLQAWQAQTLADSQYELVLVVSPSFTERDQLSALLADTDGLYRVVASESNHDMGLCAFGAEQARGEFLFFTESHCWPEQDVLALCIQAFEEKPNWAGLSCRSQPVSSNRLGAAEGAMYDAEISYGMTVHPWRKILDQCFVTRRNAYLQCGGFKPEFGHFAEWVLAANYHAHGLFLGYLPEACFYHQYLGALRELRRFSLDFVRGEIRYLADTPDEPGSHLIELPDEWIDRGNRDRALAQTLLKAALRDARRVTSKARREYFSTARRWLAPAIFGDRLHRTKAALDVAASYVGVTLAKLFRSGRKLSAAYKTYQAALQHYQRLSSIASVRSTGHQPDRAGLYHLETAGGTEFRWSEIAAAVRIDLPSGRSTIVLDCAQIFLLPNIAHLRFHLDGQTIPDDDVQLEPFRIVISIHAPSARLATLSWTCSRFDAPGDWRVLGLPLAKIDVLAAT